MTSLAIPQSAHTTGGVSSPTNTRNPVSLRIYKVLGTNFDDVATREGLRTISELYTSSGSSASENANVNGPVSSGPSESQPPLASGSASRARKDLKRDMQAQLAEGSQRFLKVFGELDQRLDQLQNHLDLMRASCDNAETQLSRAYSISGDLLERAGKLRHERNLLEAKRAMAISFLEHFTITPEQEATVTSRDIPINSDFFDVLSKVEKIQNDCALLMGDDGPTPAGDEILSATSKLLDQGYDKILRWCTTEFRSFGKELHVEVDDTMKECIQRLRQRPEMLTECLATLSRTRQTALLSSFMTALTRGPPRPIELHAHDPMRYVGDMLAWIHQAIAAEREFFESLFGVVDNRRMVGQLRDFNRDNKGHQAEEEDWITELMDLGVGRLGPPLKLRVQQTVKSQESSIMSYKIANLLQFYLTTMGRTVGVDSLISKTLQELTDLAFQVFFDAITAQGRALSQMSADVASTSPPLPLLDHLQILKEILAVYQSTLLDDSDESITEREEEETRFAKVLDALVNPAVGSIVEKNTDLRKGGWEYEVWILNSLDAIVVALDGYSFTKPKREEISRTVSEHVEKLIEDHYTSLLDECGLKEPCHALTIKKPDEPLSHLPTTQSPALLVHLQKFSHWLSTSTSILSPPLHSSHGGKIHHEALRRIAKSYEELCDAVRDPRNRYEAGTTLLGSERPFGQARLVRHVFGLEEEE